MESLRGFGSEISDRVVQNPRTSRDIVLCRLQAVQKRGESIAESSPGYIAARSVTSQTVRDVLQKSLPALTIELLGCRNILHAGLLSPAWGLTEGVNTMSAPPRAFCRKY